VTDFTEWPFVDYSLFYWGNVYGRDAKGYATDPIEKEAAYYLRPFVCPCARCVLADHLK
jgi:hypothetical protein